MNHHRKKVPCVNDAPLEPRMGALHRRLNDNVLHYPEASTVKQACCSLCHLVNPNKNVRTYSSVFQCDQCRVHLCGACFKPFHTIASVKHLKSHVMSMTKQKEEENHWNVKICEMLGLTITSWKNGSKMKTEQQPLSETYLVVIRIKLLMIIICLPP